MTPTVVVDYDGTIELREGQPNHQLIEWMKRRKTAGFRLIIWSSRDWMYYDYIKYWLDHWEVPYDTIYCGKPLGDLYIDDRAKTWDEAVKDE